jgi:hypothetical protein
MNVSAGVQRPVLDGARRNAGRRILGDDVTVAPVAEATPPIYSAASASVFSRSSTVFGIDAADQPGPFTGADAASRFQRRSSAAPALFAIVSTGTATDRSQVSYKWLIGWEAGK